jgi:hypothetical protein
LRIVPALTDEQIAAMRDPRLAGTVKLPRIEDAVKAGGVLPDGRGTSSSAEGDRQALRRYRSRHLRDAARHPARPFSSKTSTGLRRRWIPAFRDTKIAAAAQ